jgi:hypothetical protein
MSDENDAPTDKEAPADGADGKKPTDTVAERPTEATDLAPKGPDALDEKSEEALSEPTAHEKRVAAFRTRLDGISGRLKHGMNGDHRETAGAVVELVDLIHEMLGA